MNLSYFDRAQICRTGHVQNSQVNNLQTPVGKYCTSCGEEMIDKCTCGEDIRGVHWLYGKTDPSQYRPPAYCHGCGSAHTWTQKALEAANEYIMELDMLDDEEKIQLRSNIEILTKDSPQVQVAEARIQRLVKKAGSEAGRALREILVDVMSETVKRTIFQP